MRGQKDSKKANTDVSGRNVDSGGQRGQSNRGKASGIRGGELSQNLQKGNIKQTPSQKNRDNVENVVKLTNAARKKILHLRSIGVNVADIHRIIRDDMKAEVRYYDVYAAVKVAQNPVIVEA